MTASLDDLPRSPTGRVPRWVVDEARSRSAAADVTGARTLVTEPTDGPSGEAPADATRPADAVVVADLAQPTAARVLTERHVDARTLRRLERDRERAMGGRPEWGVRRIALMVWVLAVLCGLAVAGRWVLVHPGGPGAAFSELTDVRPVSVGAGALPPAGSRDYPQPGAEEADAPLGTPPAVTTSSTSYSFLAEQDARAGLTGPQTWSPCRPVHYVVNPAGAPADFTEQVTAAFADLSAATGLVFADDGVTAEAPAPARAAFQPDVYGDRWAPVLIAWSDPSVIPTLADRVAGVTSPAGAVDPVTGVASFTSGTVYLDRELLDLTQHSGQPVYVPVLRHELGHLVGLGHVDDPTQLMYSDNVGLPTYAAGDLAGLAQLGAGACSSHL